MDAPSLLVGFAAGAALAGAAGLLAVRRLREGRTALLAETERLRRAGQEAAAALDVDNADLRRRLDEVADAVLARSRAG